MFVEYAFYLQSQHIFVYVFNCMISKMACCIWELHIQSLMMSGFGSDAMVNGANYNEKYIKQKTYFVYATLSYILKRNSIL